MKKNICTKLAPNAIGPYVQAIESGAEIFTSGQLGIDPATGKLGDGVAAQTRQSMENIGAILESAGFKYEDIVKTTIFLQDLNDFTVVNGIYEQYFSNGQYPARSCIQVAKLPLGGLVEIECIAKH
jgi:2-iminobutanoate/2-iminopropanoate deaminase